MRCGVEDVQESGRHRVKRALLDRIGPNTRVTLGALCDDATRKSLAATLELPWKGNLHGISCIPAGTYLCKLRFSPKHKRDVYQVQDVPDRDNVEIHIGNTVDDTEGCVIV